MLEGAAGTGAGLGCVGLEDGAMGRGAAGAEPLVVGIVDGLLLAAMSERS